MPRSGAVFLAGGRNIHLMSSNSGGAGIRRLLRGYLDAVSLSDSVQARLWQSARVTLTQIRVLYELQEGALSAGDLCRRLGLSPASMTRVLDRLEERGLVERRRTPVDRRRVDVHLLAPGQDLLGRTPILRGSPLQLAAERMAPAARERLADALEELVEAVREVSAEASLAAAR